MAKLLLKRLFLAGSSFHSLFGYSAAASSLKKIEITASADSSLNLNRLLDDVKTINKAFTLSVDGDKIEIETVVPVEDSNVSNRIFDLLKRHEINVQISDVTTMKLGTQDFGRP